MSSSFGNPVYYGDDFHRRTQTAVNAGKVDEIETLLKSGHISSPLVRQPPGYSGVPPGMAIEVPMCNPDRHDTTIMRDSYRPLPVDEYKIQTYNHKGPMSRTVTLSYPYNPFNKLEKRADT